MFIDSYLLQVGELDETMVPQPNSEFSYVKLNLKDVF